MGKPITQAKAEVLKSAQYIDYYVENVDSFIEERKVKTEAKESYV